MCFPDNLISILFYLYFNWTLTFVLIRRETCKEHETRTKCTLHTGYAQLREGIEPLGSAFEQYGHVDI